MKTLLLCAIAVACGASHAQSQHPAHAKTSTKPKTTNAAPAAQSTIDLYAATLAAIQDYNYQPQANSFPILNWQMQSFTGGTLVQSGGSTTTYPPNQSADPQLGVLFSSNLINCDPSASQSVSTSVNVSQNSSMSITSAQNTSSSETTSLNHQLAVTVSYTAGMNGGVGGSATYTFTYGDDVTHSSSTGTTLYEGTGYTVDISQSVTQDVPPASLRTVQVQDTVVTYSDATWSANFVLQGSIDPLYYQLIRSNVLSGGPDIAVHHSDNFYGLGTPANAVYTSDLPYIYAHNEPISTAVASPNGRYAVVADIKGPIHMVYLSAANNLTTYWSAGQTYSSNAENGTYFNMVPPKSDGSCGWSYSPWISANNTTSWNSQRCTYEVGVTDTGKMYFYNDNKGQTYATSGPPGTQPVASTPSGLSATTVLGTTPVFTATGTVSETSYSNSGQVVIGAARAMTSSEMTSYCSASQAKVMPVPGTSPARTTGAQQLLLMRDAYAATPGARTRITLDADKLPASIRFAPGPMQPVQGTVVGQ